MDRKIYTIGETVYDIIFQKNGIQGGTAGGSMLNASVSLGRLGFDITFISELGRDMLGDLIISFLATNNVNTRYIDRFDDGKTPVALAFLDDDRNARYSFYKNYPCKRLQQKMPDVSENDIVLFGSFFSISPQVRQPVLDFLHSARTAGAILIYDPNIRNPHKKDLPDLLPFIYENFALADIIRASNEDFETIFDFDDAVDVFQLIKKHSKAAMILTRGGDFVSVFWGNATANYPVPDIQVVSTIGAGDSFNAGVALSIIGQNVFRPDLEILSEKQWKAVVDCGIKLSSRVCQSFENYYSPFSTK
jgi:fructokinase